MLSTCGRRGACGGVGRTIGEEPNDAASTSGPPSCVPCRSTIRAYGSALDTTATPGWRPVRLPVMSAPTATPIAYTTDELDGVAFNAEGLVGAIVQEAGTNDVLMFAWMNREALERTLQSGRTWFWSRSRREYWCKGETSG